MGCGTKKIDTLARHRPSAAACAHPRPHPLTGALLSSPGAAMKRIHDENNERARKIGIKGVGSSQANTTVRMTCSKTLLSSSGNQHTGRGLRVAARPRQDKAEGGGKQRKCGAVLALWTKKREPAAAVIAGAPSPVCLRSPTALRDERQGSNSDRTLTPACHASGACIRGHQRLAFSVTDGER